MQIITRTIVGGAIQTTNTQGIPYEPMANTTLNEKLAISPSVPLSDNEWPKMSYWCIGVGGVDYQAGADQRPKLSWSDFEPQWNAPFLMRPFVLRAEDNDLTAERRANYGLRRVETHNGKRYFAYYLKNIDQTATTTSMIKTTIRDGVATSVPHIPSSDDLSPVPRSINPAEVVPTLEDGDEYKVSSVTIIDFTEWDIDEFVAAIRIIDNDEELAVITEIGLVGAVERDVTAEGVGGSTFTFREKCVSTLMQHVSTYQNFYISNKGIQLTIEAGVTEALLTGS